MLINDQQLRTIRALADTRSPVPYLANKTIYSWHDMLSLRDAGLVAMSEPRGKGMWQVCTLARPASVLMNQLANRYARERSPNLADNPRSLAYLKEFRVVVERWCKS